jgi:sugar (pentulose or hexulose) kinase
VPGHFGHLASLNTGGVAFAWARRTLRLDHESASDIESRLASVDAGSAGVRCRPPRASGVGEASGAWMHLNLGHGPNHLLRATVESLALAVAKHLDACRAKGVTPRRLVGAGPALDSATTAQIIADATDLPLLRLRLSELSAAGAAMLACRAIQPGRNLQRIARELSPPSQTIAPGPAAAIYREMRQEVPAPTPSARRKERS